MAELKGVTPHIVVRGAGEASEWYQRALGAEERGRVPVPGGKFMQIELRFGRSAVMLTHHIHSPDPAQKIMATMNASTEDAHASSIRHLC